MAITAALLLSLPLLAVQLGLAVLHAFNEPSAISWQRRDCAMERAVASGAFWCAMGMILSDLGFSGWELAVSLLAAVMIG